MSPTCTGTRKSIWSIDAVTTYECEWRCAASAPARSIQCINRPPRSAPSGLVSLGNTSSIISDFDSLTSLGVRTASFGSIVLLSQVRMISGRRITSSPGNCYHLLRPFSHCKGLGIYRLIRLAALALRLMRQVLYDALDTGACANDRSEPSYCVRGNPEGESERRLCALRLGTRIFWRR